MTALDELTLEVPPEASFISMARMFAGSVARHFWCDEDSVEDVKIAISEACTSAVKSHQALGIPDPIMVRARCDGVSLTFEITDKGLGSDRVEGMDTATDGTLGEGVGVALIHALFEATSVGSDPTGTTVRFSMPVLTMPLED